MKNYLYISILFLCFTSCIKDPKVSPTITTVPIRAGEKSSTMTYIDFIPDIELDTFSTNTHEVSKSIIVDVNKDSTSDIEFVNYFDHVGNDYYSSCKPLNSSDNRFSINVSQLYYYKACSGCQFYYANGPTSMFNFNDTINGNNEIWTPTNLMYNQYDSLFNFYDYLCNNGSDSLFWYNAKDKYIGIRFLKGEKMYFGWLHISIDGFAHVIIHDAAFQKD